MGVDNQYFKYYDNEDYDMATKVARIRFDRPEYIGGSHKEGSKKPWTLKPMEKQMLINILKQENTDEKGYTNWQAMIIRWNRDNFHLSKEDTIAGNLDKGRCSPKMPKHIKPLPINYPMPDYTLL